MVIYRGGGRLCLFSRVRRIMQSLSSAIRLATTLSRDVPPLHFPLAASLPFSRYPRRYNAHYLVAEPAGTLLVNCVNFTISPINSPFATSENPMATASTKSSANLDRRALLILAAASALSLGIYLAASALYLRLGFPLDNSWIHLTYAAQPRPARRVGIPSRRSLRRFHRAALVGAPRHRFSRSASRPTFGHTSSAASSSLPSPPSQKFRRAAC